MEQRTEALTVWVAEKYAGHLIPLSGEPYFSHCLAVAQTVAPYIILGCEAGLCHDLLEDHITTAEALRTALLAFAYTVPETEQIVAMVNELSDVFHPDNYSDTGKKKLRWLETQRLATISSAAQTIKYADLIDNAIWVRQHEPHKWQRYANRKRKLLHLLDKGDPILRQQALGIFFN
ncbi:HD domain-containing protein [Mucilaginibacter yixingensis]|uniref:HD domain-containing protein n=1 Tax=Mucilaginibacter yixingensis TaxID=1295612 RepID=A0A2T5JEB0_9SPHI|nr:HD domain-containing protein [Mucilaginibacter yixingensis]PTR00098.1 HD domain-containing protein [Mucilaginibacter yixingensis]